MGAGLAVTENISGVCAEGEKVLITLPKSAYINFLYCENAEISIKKGGVEIIPLNFNLGKENIVKASIRYNLPIPTGREGPMYWLKSINLTVESKEKRKGKKYELSTAEFA